MPICTTCTEFIPYLYTVYESADNLRLEQCPNPKCRKFADPYVESDDLVLFMDLILLKRGVFRHLLFNRGYPPRQALTREMEKKPAKLEVIRTEREFKRWETILRLGASLIFVDAFIRWCHIRSPLDGSSTWTKDEVEPLMRIFGGCIIETLAFHAGVTITSAVMLQLVDLIHRQLGPAFIPRSSGVKAEFRLSHVPLTLLFSSLTKLFLLLMLALWKPSLSSIGYSNYSGLNDVPPPSRLPAVVHSALSLLDDENLDRGWIVRNVLGGMAAGFGLRVVLDINPFFTTIVVVAGWAVKTYVANYLHPWVSSGGGDVFLAYSIP
ncbi:Arv1-domain-containing protein [Schizopora paradoxa]|uniref:Protein ARV n=1 Tax=Schizopora paradoxa TaxID=27342 RepID=A0A0H2S841_9AGAM|nr:Arv1-domain-containing protein [Schizopora paradoxa]